MFSVTLALLLSLTRAEALGVVAVVVTLVGLWLNWRRPVHEAEIEEAVKDGKLTTEQAWRRNRWVRRRAKVVVTAGVLLMGAGLLTLFG